MIQNFSAIRNSDNLFVYFNTLFKFNKGDVLSIEDLSEVYTKFFDARDKWFNIGLALNINFTALKSIKSEQHDNDDCLREMLAHRIQSGGPLTWADLSDCLRHPIIKRNDLAKNIDQGLGILL